MPRDPLENYFSDEEFAELVKKLNALTHPAFQWRWIRARKEHEDLFGETIHHREQYFKRENGVAWGEDIKVSRLSMERMLFAIFSANWGLEELAENIIKRQMEELKEEHSHYSPLAILDRRKKDDDQTEQ